MHESESKHSRDWWSNKKRALAIILFLIVLVVGGWLRVHQLAHNPFWVDEGISVLVAKEWKAGNGLVLPSGNEYTRAALSTYLIGISMTLFGETEVAARLPSVIAGIVTIVLTYLIGSRVGGRRVGVLASAVVAVSAIEIAWSRQARMYAVFQMMVLATIYGYLQFRKRPSITSGLATIVTALFTKISNLAWVVILPAIGVDALVSLKNKKYIKPIAVWVLPVVSVVLVTSFLLGGTEILSGLYWKLQKAMELPREVVPDQFGYLWIAALIGAASLKRSDWRTGGLVAVNALSILIILSWAWTYFGQPVWIRYLFVFFPFLIIFGVKGITESSYRLLRFMRRLGPKKQEHKGLHGPVSTAVIGLLSGLTVLALAPQLLPVNLSLLSELEEPQPDYRAAAAYVYEHKQEEDVIVVGRGQIAAHYFEQVDADTTTEFADESLRTGYTTDSYTGVPVLRNRSSIERYIALHERGWLVFNPYERPPESEVIVQQLSHELTVPPLYPGDDPVFVYSWGRD